MNSAAKLDSIAKVSPASRRKPPESPTFPANEFLASSPLRLSAPFSAPFPALIASQSRHASHTTQPSQIITSHSLPLAFPFRLSAHPPVCLLLLRTDSHPISHQRHSTPTPSIDLSACCRWRYPLRLPASVHRLVSRSRAAINRRRRRGTYYSPSLSGAVAPSLTFTLSGSVRKASWISTKFESLPFGSVRKDACGCAFVPPPR
mgnify:CR=1 FL=1